MRFISKGNRKDKKERGLIVYGHEVNELNIFSAETMRNTVEKTMHAHPHGFEIILIIKGKMIIETPEEKITLKEGDLFYCPPGLMHRAKAEKGTVTANIRNDTKKFSFPFFSSS